MSSSRASSRINNSHVVRYLLEQGLEPNSKDRDGWTPLHWAAKGGSVDTIKILQSAGAVLTFENIKGWLPSSVAIFTCRGENIKLALESESSTPNSGVNALDCKPTPTRGVYRVWRNYDGCDMVS